VEGHFVKLKSAKFEFASLPKDYDALVRLLAPRPIHDRVEFQNVVEIADAMAGHKLGADQEDYFDLLCRLMEDYEKEILQMPPANVSAIETLQALLDAHGMTAADLARLLEVHRTLGAMIVRGERKLTLNHVRTLARHFGVSADVFLD
jgi:HTH-type transcriptional regulator/antitoxin HigA